MLCSYKWLQVQVLMHDKFQTVQWPDHHDNCFGFLCKISLSLVRSVKGLDLLFLSWWRPIYQPSQLLSSANVPDRTFVTFGSCTGSVCFHDCFFFLVCLYFFNYLLFEKLSFVINGSLILRHSKVVHTAHQCLQSQKTVRHGWIGPLVVELGSVWIIGCVSAWVSICYICCVC